MKNDAPRNAALPVACDSDATLSQPNTPSLQRTLAPAPVPDHELIRPIGRGAYGEVWLARHARLGTLRAVKIVRRDQFDDARPFQREFDGIRRYEPISRGHPSLVAILQVGGTEDCFFYVMELADSANSNPCSVISDSPAPPVASPGHAMSPADSPNTDLLITDYSPHTLRSELKGHGALSIDRCLEIALALASALARLHGRGLVHRDVKPSNVIFVGGVAKLADIGLVAAVSDSRSFVGTEGYIPPEGPGTPSADCYALGKLLYELSTGHDRTAWPEPPADLPTRPDRERLLELNAILHKACAPDARERYHNAEEMQADLELLNADKSVKQRHSTQRRWKFAKKAAIVAAAGTLIATGFVCFVWIRHPLPQPLDPLTTGKNVGGYPPTRMRGTTNKEAWDHYRLAYSAASRWNKEGADQAAEHYNAAIRLDPKFTLAYAGVWRMKFGDPWYLTHTKSDEFRRLAQKLVELDNGLAETHQVLAAIRFWEWRFPQAEAECREALRLNPDCLPALITLGFHLSHQGRTDEALQVLDRGLQIDPNAANITKHKGHIFFVRRQFQHALELYLEASRREPLFHQPHFFAGRAYLALTNYPAAIDEFERDELLPGDVALDQTKRKYTELRRAFRDGGVRGYWLKKLELAEVDRDADEYPYEYGQLYEAQRFYRVAFP